MMSFYFRSLCLFLLPFMLAAGCEGGDGAKSPSSAPTSDGSAAEASKTWFYFSTAESGGMARLFSSNSLVFPAVTTKPFVGYLLISKENVLVGVNRAGELPSSPFLCAVGCGAARFRRTIVSFSFDGQDDLKWSPGLYEDDYALAVFPDDEPLDEGYGRFGRNLVEMITRSSKMVIRVPCATWIEKSDGGACGGDGIMDLEFDTRGFDPTKVGL